MIKYLAKLIRSSSLLVIFTGEDEQAKITLGPIRFTSANNSKELFSETMGSILTPSLKDLRMEK